MAEPRCEQLDEYLCGWLSPDEAAEFAAHLAGCSACREECAVQRRIDRLLAEGAAGIEPVPAALADRIERGVRAARRRRRVGWACALTAAAGIVLALGLWGAPRSSFLRNDARPVVTAPVAADDLPQQPVLPSSAKPQAAAIARVTLVDSSSAILVPVESHSPNVTVVRIYPTVKIAREGAKPSP
jgi:anti-sigma factor RsiW